MKVRRKLWNNVASYYDVIWKVADYSPVLHSIMEEADIVSGMLVIDVAAGTGVVGLEAARKIGQDGIVLCIDYSKSMLKKALEKAKLSTVHNVGFVLADVHNLPFMGDCFNVATCCWGFSFFSDSPIVANEMRRVVKHRGKVIVVEWEKPPIEFWLDLRKKSRIRDFEESELVSIFRTAGLKGVSSRKIQISHRTLDVSQDLLKKSQLYVLTITDLKEEDGTWFFKKLNNEYRKLPLEKRHWLPVLYVGKK